MTRRSGPRPGRPFFWTHLILTLVLCAGSARAADFVWDGTCVNGDWHATCSGAQCSSDPVRYWIYNNWGLSTCGSDPGPAFPGPADHVYLPAPGAVLSSSASIAYLTIQFGGGLTVDGQPAVLTPSGGLTNSGQLVVQNGGALALGTCTVNNPGDIILRYGGMWGEGLLHCGGAVGLDGAGALFLECGIIDGAGTLTNNAGHTVRGSNSRIAVALANDGLLSADVAGGPLRLVTAAKTNSGTVQATNGANLQIETAITQSTSGVIRADGTSSTVSLAGGSSITNGTLDTSAAGLIDANHVTTTFTDLTNLGQCRIWNDATLVLTGTTLTNHGEIGLHYGGTYGNGHLRFDSNVTVTGSGGVHVADGDVTTSTGVSFTNAAGHTFRGRGPLNVAMLNEGAIVADWPGYTLTINPQTPGVTNSGRLEAQPGCYLTINNAALFAQAGGQTVVNGTLSVNGAPLDLQGGVLTGSGTVSGSVVNSGASVEPGTSAGILTITGNYTQNVAGRLAIQLGGPDPGTGYDRLALSGSATLAGELNISTANGFEPTPGQQFVILTAGSVSGSFSSTTGPVSYQVIYNPQNVTVVVLAPCVGDLNCDGHIDFGDINPFVLYLSNFGAWQAAFPNGDINCDGTYGQASFGDINPFVALMGQCGVGCACPGPIACP